MRIVKPDFAIEKLAPGREILQGIERAGRTCYKSEDRITDESAEAFVKMIIERGHLSVIEHDYMSVRFICDRGVTHELVRHRLVAYSQESTRFCNYSKGKYGREITVIKPCFWDEKVDHESCYQWWYDACHTAEKIYLALLERGAKPEEARSVLPNSLKTEIVATANLRQWGHIFFQRTSPKAHPQMRELMVPLLEGVRKLVPVIFDNLDIYK
jgi:thymidylate synthase (FAD)